MTDAADARVRVYSRHRCHLCEQAIAVVDRVCVELGERYDVVDVDSDAELQREYGEQVPVTLVDGRRHDFFRVDERRLRDALGSRGV